MNRPWTPEEEATLKRMMAEGVRLQEIAVCLGRTINSVRNKSTHKHRKETLYDWKKRLETDTQGGRYIRKIRKCLSCREKFMSKWIGNRLCVKCNQLADSRRGAFL